MKRGRRGFKESLHISDSDDPNEDNKNSQTLHSKESFRGLSLDQVFFFVLTPSSSTFSGRDLNNSRGRRTPAQRGPSVVLYQRMETGWSTIVEVNHRFLSSVVDPNFSFTEGVDRGTFNTSTDDKWERTWYFSKITCIKI